MTTGLTIVLAAAIASLAPSVSPRRSPSGSVPVVAWSAGTAARSTLVAAPVTEVTVYSDRARVRRRGRAPAASGILAVRFPGLPGAVFLDTIRVAASGGRVLRVEATPVQRERSTVVQATKLLDALDGVADRLAEVDDRVATDDWEVGFLRALAPAPLVPEDKREGRKNPPADVASWLKALDFVADRTRAASGQILRAQSERAGLVREKERLLADYNALDRGGLADRIVDVVAIVEVDRADVELELEYFIPGASWRPTYDVHFASASGQVRVETAGVVGQTTGEDWSDVALLLSTAKPGRGIDLPERLAWTLGERSDFVPRLQAREEKYLFAPDVDHDGIPDTVDKCPDAPEDGDGDIDGCPEPETLNGWEGSNGKKDVEALRREIVVLRGGTVGRLADAPAVRHPPEKDVPAEEPLRLRVEVDNAQIRTTVPMALLDSSAKAEAKPSDPYLPAVSAGGFDHVYRAPTRATIASSNKQIRVPLASQAFRADAFYQATPALAATAFLRARVRNDGKRPLLRGPATIFGDGEFVAVGEIKTTGPGGDIELPLGADQDVRIERHVVPSTRTTGLIMKSDETSYDVVIQVGNYKKQKVAIEVVDQLPRSGHDKVEVKLVGAQPAALGAPDADGVLRWRLELAPGSTQTVKLTYRIARPKGWQLQQDAP